MKAGKKLLALLLTVCMLLCMLPTVAFASGSDYLKIAMLDSGRKYFSADWVKAFLYEAKADGYTHVMLAVGNDGMRFLLDDMSLTVGGKTYSSNAVASAIRAATTPTRRHLRASGRKVRWTSSLPRPRKPASRSFRC